jgi:hypothetical protein
MTQFLETFLPGLASTASESQLQFDQWLYDFVPGIGVPDVPDPLTAPASTAVYLNGIRDVTIQAGNQRPLIRVTDGNLNIMTELMGELSCTMEDLSADTGKVTLTILYDNWLVNWMTQQTMDVEDLNLLIDPIPTQPDWRTRWGGKITELHVKKDAKGIHSIEITALHFREHAKRLLVAANPIFPPEIQLPRMWVLPGPMRTIGFITAFVNLARLFMPGWSTITNIANPAGWINPLGPDAVLNVLPTEWPIQPAFVDPVLDQSRWTTIGATWNDWHSVFGDLLTDSGCQMRFYTYLTTDPDSPNVELASILNLGPDLLAQLGIDLGGLTEDIESVINKLTAPQRNAVVCVFENISGVTGPTGTAADGLISTVAITLDDLITPIAINPSTGETFDPGQVLNGEPVEDATGLDRTYLLEQLTDTAPAPPKVIWWDSYYNGMESTDLTWHKGSVKTIMTGSKSPTIVNEAQTFAIRYALAQLSMVLNWWLGVGAGGQQQTPGTPGLDNLYQNQLDNTLLAWERFTDPIRAVYAGDMAWQEHFEKGSGTAYTLASILTLRSGDWKTRAFAAFKAKTIDGHPWIAHLDFNVGDRVGFEQNGIIYVDNVVGIKREWDWQKPITVSVSIGEDKNKSDPFNAAFKTMAAMYSLVGELAGQGTLFG